MKSGPSWLISNEKFAIWLIKEGEGEYWKKKKWCWQQHILSSQLSKKLNIECWFNSYSVKTRSKLLGTYLSEKKTKHSELSIKNQTPKKHLDRLFVWPLDSSSASPARSPASLKMAHQKAFYPTLYFMATWDSCCLFLSLWSLF